MNRRRFPGFGATAGISACTQEQQAADMATVPLQPRGTVDTGTHRGEQRQQEGIFSGASVNTHGLISRPMPFEPMEFEIPKSATADGNLTLTWRGEPGRGGNGQGTQVAEVWLIKS